MTESTGTPGNHRPALMHAYFGYRDAPAALRWLERAFGFETTAEYPDADGGIMHAEMRRGDASIAVFSDSGASYERTTVRGETTGHGVYLSLSDEADVDAVYRSAVENGATVIWPVARSEWNYRFRVLDVEGFEWTFGAWRPGERHSD